MPPRPSAPKEAAPALTNRPITRRDLLAAGAGALAFARPAWAAPEEAETIFAGGPILTMNDAAPRAEALAAAGGRILAVGRHGAVMAHRGKGTRVIDLAGRALLPGFVEPHVHVVGSAVTADLLDVGIFSGAKTTDDVLAKLRDAA